MDILIGKWPIHVILIDGAKAHCALIHFNDGAMQEIKRSKEHLPLGKGERKATQP